MTIPEVRTRLDEIADGLVGTDLGKELRVLAAELWRRRSPRSTTVNERIRSRSLTPELAASIRSYAAAHADETEHEIGIKFGVNQGRVSEALYGKRT